MVAKFNEKNFATINLKFSFPLLHGNIAALGHVLLAQV